MRRLGSFGSCLLVEVIILNRTSLGSVQCCLIITAVVHKTIFCRCNRVQLCNRFPVLPLAVPALHSLSHNSLALFNHISTLGKLGHAPVHQCTLKSTPLDHCQLKPPIQYTGRPEEVTLGARQCRSGTSQPGGQPAHDLCLLLIHATFVACCISHDSTCKRPSSLPAKFFTC